MNRAVVRFVEIWPALAKVSTLSCKKMALTNHMISLSSMHYFCTIFKQVYRLLSVNEKYRPFDEPLCL